MLVSREGYTSTDTHSKFFLFVFFVCFYSGRAEFYILSRVSCGNLMDVLYFKREKKEEENKKKTSKPCDELM